MTNVKSLLELYVKMGGSLTDTYSDIAGGVPVGQYSTISDAILACSKKYSSGGGGGAETYTVHASFDEETQKPKAEESIADIIAADGEGKTCVCEFDVGSAVYRLSLSLASDAEDVVVFYCCAPIGDQNVTIVVTGSIDGASDEWNLASFGIVNIPAYDISDDVGKVLTVTSSGPAWVTPA